MTAARDDIRTAFPFTERDDAAARAAVEGDLVHIATRALDTDPHLVALVLTGGFSRGEGTVHDGKPVNDYDLVAVRSRPGGAALHRRLAHELTREVGLEVDLLPAWRARLPHVGRKLFWLDLRLGGRVIAGDDSVLRQLPGFGADDVPLAEVARLLGNRAAGLLLALPGAGEPADAKQRDLQATKALIAAMDATLLSRGEYAARLRDRLALTRGDADHALFAKAVAWKLGHGQDMGDAWWDQAAAALLRAVDTTGARACRDSLVERAYHLLRARRVARSPSQDVRRAAWDTLALARWPEGAPSWSATTKRAFFEARARTLQ